MKNVLLFLSAVLVSLILCEALVRLTVPQNLSGSWRELSQDKSYLLNKSSGISKHQFGERQVVYRFEFPHPRSTENEKKNAKRRFRFLVIPLRSAGCWTLSKRMLAGLKNSFSGRGWITASIMPRQVGGGWRTIAHSMRILAI